jgi:hypothetical protein
MQRPLQTIMKLPYASIMPSTPLYIHRLEDGVAALEAGPEWVDRRMLEEALGVSKWTAWRILKRCGADDGPGGALVCRRDDLVRQLRGIQEGKWAPEVERRKRVERYLGQIARFSTQKHMKIAENDAANAILSAKFGDLPPGIELRKGQLRIEFSGSADFLQKFGAVVFALQNEFDQIRDFLDS